MRIGLFAVGRMKQGPEKELAARYLDRFAKAVGQSVWRLPASSKSRMPGHHFRRTQGGGGGAAERRSAAGIRWCCSTNAANRSIPQASHNSSVAFATTANAALSS